MIAITFLIFIFHGAQLDFWIGTLGCLIWVKAITIALGSIAGKPIAYPVKSATELVAKHGRDLAVEHPCRSCSLQMSPEGLEPFGNAHEACGRESCSCFRVLKNGDILDVSSHSGDGMIAICAGILGLQHMLSDGRRTLTELFMQGDLISEERVPDGTQIVALTNARIALDPLRGETSSQPNLVERTRAYSQRLGRQSRILCDHCADVAMKTPPERLAAFLCEYCKRHPVCESAEQHTNVQLSRNDIASYIASEPETVSRSFSRLIETGAIQLQGRYNLRVNDEAKLQRIADGGLPRQRRGAR